MNLVALTKRELEVINRKNLKYPLAIAEKCLGVIGLRPFGLRPLSPDQVQLLMALAALVAGTIERINLADQVRDS